jgi:hypothetical protein
VRSLNATPTPTSCALARAARRLERGAVVSLVVERAHVDASDVVSYGPPTVADVRTVASGAPTGSTSCDPNDATSVPALGITLATTRTVAQSRLAVRIDVANVGGPSAGLALALGVVDAVAGGDLTAGRRVAATGTIDPEGAVGDVGGVEQKTVAVERAGASIFLVPVQERSVAQRASNGHLVVVAVRSLAAALAYLHRTGHGDLRESPARPVGRS